MATHLRAGETLRLAILLALTMVAVACRPTTGQESPPPRAPLSLSELLAGGDTEGFARALEPWPFTFPDDHGAHPEFRSEWWYLTGNLSSAAGRRFGYQFTLFRNALAPGQPTRDSDWATHQVYMAHLALTDVTGGSFHAFERFSRGALGLAGVTARPFRAWLEDWELTGEDPPPFRLDVATGGLALELRLSSAKPLVLQGDRGLSRKGRKPGNASYYYSLTRLPTRGVVTLGYKSHEVQGSSWLDREWSTSALEQQHVGWDWFALQLSDGQDLMIYQLRRRDGDKDPLSAGTLVATDGSTRGLAAGDFELDVLDHWKSPATETRYPSRWRILVPGAELELVVTPLLPDQELSLSVRYWEGAVAVSGSSRGVAVAGQGYVELTGYE